MPSSLFLSFPFCTLVLCRSPCSLTSWPYLFSLSSLIPCRYLQFTLRLGSRSILSSCPAPDQPGEGVLLHYSSDNGITWTLLQHYAYQGFHEPRYFLYLNLLFSHECGCFFVRMVSVTPLTHTYVLSILCWRCLLLGPIETVSGIFVCNEEWTGWAGFQLCSAYVTQLFISTREVNRGQWFSNYVMPDISTVTTYFYQG